MQLRHSTHAYPTKDHETLVSDRENRVTLDRGRVAGVVAGSLATTVQMPIWWLSVTPVLENAVARRAATEKES